MTKYDAVTDPQRSVISGNVANVNTTSGQEAIQHQMPLISGMYKVSVATLKSMTIRYMIMRQVPMLNPASHRLLLLVLFLSTVQHCLGLKSDFSGHRQAQNVVLNWKTQQEVNAQSYSIERSTGSSWETIASVAASGNGNGSADYTYTDINPQGSLLLIA